MKRSTLILLASSCLLTACALENLHPGYENMNIKRSNDAVRIYDGQGNFVGTVDEANRIIYDRSGNYIGRIQ